MGSDFVVAATEFFSTSRLLRQVNATAIALFSKHIGGGEAF